MEQQTSPAGKTKAIVEELAELTPIARFRELEVYRFSGTDYPETLREIGRLRAEVLQVDGSGSGRVYGADEWDYGESGYVQLMAWDPKEEEVVAMYRYQLGIRGLEFDESYLRTSELFAYSDHFRRDILPYAFELGYSIVNPSAKRSYSGFFALWKGLGSLIRFHPEIHYFFGNISLPVEMNPKARDYLIRYVQTNYPSPEPYLQHAGEEGYHPDTDEMPAPVDHGEADTPKNRIRKLSRVLSDYEEQVPQILKSYMSVSNDIWFGDAVHSRFGYEVAIIVPIANVKADFRKEFMGIEF